MGNKKINKDKLFIWDVPLSMLSDIQLNYFWKKREEARIKAHIKRSKIRNNLDNNNDRV